MPSFTAIQLRLLALGIFVCPGYAPAQPQAILEVGIFSAATEGGELPNHWKPLSFKKIERKTVYTLVKDEGVVVVKAVAEASASGLTRETRIDLTQHPRMQWRWKISNTLQKSDPRKKSGDDYPARIYVTFRKDKAKLSLSERAKNAAARLLYGQEPPYAALSYVWDSKSAVGTILPNAYTARLKMVIVQSGMTNVGRWLTEERNIYEDYKQAFGEEPPLVSGVAVMSDTDNTGETASAYYGDILFKP